MVWHFKLFVPEESLELARTAWQLPVFECALGTPAPMSAETLASPPGDSTENAPGPAVQTAPIASASPASVDVLPASPLRVTVPRPGGESGGAPLSSPVRKAPEVCFLSIERLAGATAAAATGAPATAASTCSSDALEPGAVPFFTGNPAVSIQHGRLRLFRDLNPCAQPGRAMAVLPEIRSCVVCVLGVPGHLTAADVIRFCGGFDGAMQQLHIIRDGSPCSFSVLITFRLQEDADAFFSACNGRTFSSLEPETARLAFVGSIELLADSGEALAYANTTELPSCPVCLERMDASASGLFTTQCAHSFHTSCLARWPDASCPVCRFVAEPADVVSCCFDCSAETNLWICLVCGNVGCGRYASGHAFEHFQTKRHAYSMDLATQRVWDYVNDGYVHRLVQTKEPGQLVELPDPNFPLDARAVLAQGPLLETDKIEALGTEYNALLRTYLESQREHYETVIQSMMRKHDAVKLALEEQVREQAGAFARLQTERKGLERQLASMRAAQQRLTEEHQFVLELNRSLSATQAEFRAELDAVKDGFAKKLEKKDAELAQMNETMRDLMLTLEHRDTIERHGGAGGELVVEVGSAGAGPARGRRKYRR